MHIDEVSKIKQDIAEVTRLLRPMRRQVLNHICDDLRTSAMVVMYLEDVKDHLEQSLDDLQAFYDTTCRGLDVDYDSNSDRRMNQTLYLLTLITSILIPGQFLTGLFGMNFVGSRTGDAADPLSRNVKMALALRERA